MNSPCLCKIAVPNRIPGQQPQSLHIKHSIRLAWVGLWGLRIFLEALGMGFPCLFPPGCGAGPVQGQRFGCYRQIPVPNSGQHAENVQVRQKNRLPSLASRVCFWAQGAPKGAPPVIFSCPTTVVPPPCPIPAPLVKRDGPVFGRSGPVPGATGGCGCVPSLPQVP